MKFNLKNRPKTCFEQELCVADGDLAKWFEGFEKQETERLQKAKTEMIRLGREEPENRMEWYFWNGYAQAKKEILGEK